MNHYAESTKSTDTTTDYMHNGERIARVTTPATPFEDIDDTAPVSTPITVEDIRSAFSVTEGTARKWLREGRLTTLEALTEQRNRGYSFHRNYSSELLINAMTGA